MDVIYTIGYGTRDIVSFINILKSYGIGVIVDIRSSPYSSFNADFNRDRLRAFLKRENIKYAFMGEELGGRFTKQKSRSRKNLEYALRSSDKDFREAVDKLINYESGLVALLCSEGKPGNCHRSKLVGEALHRSNVNVIHIDENAEIKSHQEIMTGYQVSLL